MKGFLLRIIKMGVATKGGGLNFNNHGERAFTSKCPSMTIISIYLPTAHIKTIKGHNNTTSMLF